MISYVMTINDDNQLFHLLESNDKNFSNRATITISKEKNIVITLKAKDLSAFRAAHKSIENTLLVWEKAKNAI